MEINEMSLAPRIERLNRRKRKAKQPVRLILELMEDRTVPAQAIAVGPDLSLVGPGPNSGTKIGETLYFLARQNTDAPGVSEIWQVSGTATAQMLNVPALAGMSIDEIANVGSALYVTAATPPAQGSLMTPSSVNLWKIDPTAAGGADELTNFSGAGAANLQVLGTKLIFEDASLTGLIPSSSSASLWTSDGTVAGTTQVYAFTGDAQPDLTDAAAAGSDLYFQVDAYSTPTPPELFVTDGTTAGTQAVTAAGGGTAPSPADTALIAIGNAVYFSASNGTDAELWSATNGQASLAESFAPSATDPSPPTISDATTANGLLYFAVNHDTDSEVWSSDGTTAGTMPIYQPPVVKQTPVPPPGPTATYISDIAVLNGSVYFTEVNGGGLIKADGQGGATSVPLPAGVSGASFLTAVNGQLYFMADDGIHGTELWTTDGTTAGTTRLTDINPGSGSSFPIGPEEAGGSLYVIASDGIPAAASLFAPEQLWQLPDPSAPAGAASTVTLTPSAPAVITGGSVTLTATVAAIDPTQPAPTGEVVFRDDQEIYGAAPIVNGVATLNATISVAGAHNLQAVYTGDTNFDESISTPVSVSAGQSNTSLVLNTSNPTPEPGQSITFTASISQALNAPSPPSGSVDFFDGTTFLGDGAVNADVAMLQTSGLTAGSHTITANYSGDTSFLPSTAAPVMETVGPNYTVSLSLPQSSTTLGQPLTLTSQVTPGAGSSLVPGMTVLFRDGALSIGSAPVNASGVATLTTSSLGVGVHNLSAVVFNSGMEFDSPVEALSVQPAATTAILHSTAPTVIAGQSITLTFTIATPAAGMPAPTGIVTLKDGMTVLGTVIVANDRAVLLVSNLALGNHPITATYQGDANYAGSSASLNQTVTANTVSTSLAIQPLVTTSIVGQQIALTAILTPSAGTAIPAGSVTFYDGTALLGAVKIDPVGHALLLTSSLTTGNYSITAVFGGSGIYAGSTSAPVSVAVRFGATANLSAAPTTIISGQATTLTATVGATGGSAIQPAGTVTFYDGNTALGTATLQNGVTRFTTSALRTVGVQRLTAVYGGNNLFATTSTEAVYVTVRAISTTTTILSPAPPAANTGVVTLTANIGVGAPGSGAATGKVTFYDRSAAIGSANVSNGTATVQISKLTPSSHYLRAVFAGTGTYGGSDSAVIRFTIAAPTSTSLVALAVGFGQTTSLKATVSVLSPGLGNANGTVTFKDGSTVLGSATLLNGVATLGVKLPTGPHTLTATYTGNSNFAASAAAPLAYAVAKAKPTLAIKASANPKAGSVVTLTTSAGPATAGAVGPRGSILLTDGASIVGVGTIVNGAVTIQTTKLTKGTNVLTATYAGDGNYSGATATLALTVA
jgi:ELWxxDGT repeat protein